MIPDSKNMNFIQFLLNPNFTTYMSWNGSKFVVQFGFNRNWIKITFLEIGIIIQYCPVLGFYHVLHCPPTDCSKTLCCVYSEGGFIVVGQILPSVKLILGAMILQEWGQHNRPFFWSFLSHFVFVKMHMSSERLSHFFREKCIRPPKWPTLIQVSFLLQISGRNQFDRLTDVTSLINFNLKLKLISCRLLLLEGKDPKTHSEIMKLMDHNDERKGSNVLCFKHVLLNNCWILMCQEFTFKLGNIFEQW